MEANQITVRLDDEEYVRSVWERAESCPHGYSDNDPVWSISLGGRMFTKANVPEPDAGTEAEAWSAAAEFTRERLEQVRQLREEMDVVAQAMWRCKVGDFIQRVAVWKRVFTRLEAELATLTRGMKPEALEGATR